MSAQDMPPWRKWRAAEAPGAPLDRPAREDLAQDMRRAMVAECLDTLPRDVAAAQFALECGSDWTARLHIERIVLATNEAVRTFNELCAASARKGGAQ